MKAGGRMTATDELRRLLDERGVKWETDRSGFRVMWGKPVDEFHDTMQFKAVDNALPNGGLNVHICGFTPEQAIAATLGSVTIEKAAERIEVLSGLAREYLHRYGMLMSMAGEDVTDEVLAIESVINEVCGKKVAGE
jgi:hypothetical protein